MTISYGEIVDTFKVKVSEGTITHRGHKHVWWLKQPKTSRLQQFKIEDADDCVFPDDLRQHIGDSVKSTTEEL